MRFVIRTFERYEVIKAKTLKVLQSNNVKPEDVDIFVANEEELEKYKKSLEGTGFNNLIVGVKGLNHVTNFIANYYPLDAELVYFDDDIIDISIAKEGKLVKMTNLLDFCKRAFDLLNTTGFKLWGVYPIKNAFFMDDKITSDLKFCVGAFFGAKNERLDLQCSAKEDYERTLKSYFKNGGVIRFNKVAVNTGYYCKSGGLASMRTAETVNKEVEYLAEKFSGHIVYNKLRNNFVEIKIK